MCGRYAFHSSRKRVAAQFGMAEMPLFEPRYNIAPDAARVRRPRKSNPESDKRLYSVGGLFQPGRMIRASAAA